MFNTSSRFQPFSPTDADTSPMPYMPSAVKTVAPLSVVSNNMPYGDYSCDGTFKPGMKAQRSRSVASVASEPSTASSASPWMAFNSARTPIKAASPTLMANSKASINEASLVAAANGSRTTAPSFTRPQWVPRAENSPSPTSASNTLRDALRKVEERDETIAELKQQIETLIAAISLGQTVDNFDGAEMVHRTLSRMRTLRQENERLAGLASHQYSARLEVDVDALKKENEQLKRQLYQ